MANAFLNLRHGSKMAKAKDMELEQMSMGEIDELERKLAELKKQKMKVAGNLLILIMMLSLTGMT